MRKIRLCASTRGGGYPIVKYYYPLTRDGFEKAKAKRTELMVKYLDAIVELEVIDQ